MLQRQEQKPVSRSTRKNVDLVGIGMRIKALRGEMLQEQFAKLAGISQGQLSKIEHGRLAPSINTLVRVAEVAGRSLDWIVHGGESQ